MKDDKDYDNCRGFGSRYPYYERVSLKPITSPKEYRHVVFEQQKAAQRYRMLTRPGPITGPNPFYRFWALRRKIRPFDWLPY